MTSSRRILRIPEPVDGLAVGDLVRIDSEGQSGEILEFESGGTGALVQLSSGDKVAAGFVQMTHARRFTGRRWVPVHDVRISG